ncbi:LptF/LptG family permease, partial [bacterium]|nr:LptF/LptG family permease [bacterium]
SEMSSAELEAAIGRKRGALEERRGDVERQRAEARAQLMSAYGKAEGAPSGVPPAELLQEIKRSMASARQAATALPADRSLQIYELEHSKKYAIPAAAFFFSLLAFPLGLGARRAGRTAGFGIALLLSSLYWGLLFIGQTFGLRSQISPRLAMWLPNLLVLAATMVVWGIRRKGQRRSV